MNTNPSQLSLGIESSYSQNSLASSIDRLDRMGPGQRPQTAGRLEDIAPADMREGRYPPALTPRSARVRPSTAARLENIPPSSSESSRPATSRYIHLPLLQEEDKEEEEEQSRRERLQNLKEYQTEWRQKHVALQRRKTAAMVSSRMRALEKAEEERMALQTRMEKQVTIEEQEEYQDEDMIAGALSNLFGKKASAEPEPPPVSAMRRQSSKHLSSQGSARSNFETDGRSVARRASSKPTARMVSKEDPREHVDIMSNTEAGIVSPRRHGRGKTGTFELTVILAKKHALPMDVVRARMAEFKKFDEDGNNSLAMSEFEHAIKSHCKIDKDQPLPEQIRAANLACADRDKDGSIDFEEYLLWSMQTSFVEEMLVPDPAVREFRQVIRDHNLDPLDVDKIRAVFTTFDTDGSGEIEWEEFKALLCKLLNVRSETDIPSPELRRRWREADILNQGKINFEQFVVWYAKAGYIDQR